MLAQRLQYVPKITKSRKGVAKIFIYMPPPPYTVLKILKGSENEVEVAGEFPDEEQAMKFAESAQADDIEGRYEYSVECPPFCE